MIGATLLTLVTGCMPGPMAAPYGYEVSVVSAEQTFVIDSEFITAGDGVGYLALEEVLVVDESEFPANGIRVEVVSGWSGAYVIAEESVKMVTDLEDGCDAGEQDGEDCDVWFDSYGNQHVEFSGEYESVDEFRPTYLASMTDNRGMMRFYTFIDSVPIDENGEPISITMYVSIGVSSTTRTYEFN